MTANNNLLDQVLIPPRTPAMHYYHSHPWWHDMTSSLVCARVLGDMIFTTLLLRHPNNSVGEFCLCFSLPNRTLFYESSTPSPVLHSMNKKMKWTINGHALLPFQRPPIPDINPSATRKNSQVWPTNRVIQFIIQHNNLMLFGSPKQCNTKRINNCHPLAFCNSLLCSALVRSPAELPLYLGDDVNTLPSSIPVWLSSIPTIPPPKKKLILSTMNIVL